jgi:hypothetical protein
MTFLQRGQAGKQVQPLKDVAHPAPAQRGELPVAKLREVFAVDQDPPIGRTVKTAGQLQQRRLARPAETHHSHQLARRNRQAHLRQRGH